MQLQSLKILFLGDSYTVGEGVEAHDTYPAQLVQKLKLQHKEVHYDIIAKTGWTTGELLEEIKKTSLSHDYDKVFLLIGVNNQYRGYSLQEYKTEFQELLSLSKRFCADKSENVTVLSIPDWGVTPFAEGKDRRKIAEEIDEFNKANKQICLSQNIHRVDVTGISRKAGEDHSLLAADQLHPSGRMYGMWTEVIVAVGGRQ
ncbi:MAG: SGNH/GDSL hydrolase family protein [Cytophagaceae bacterium]